MCMKYFLFRGVGKLDCARQNNWKQKNRDFSRYFDSYTKWPKKNTPDFFNAAKYVFVFFRHTVHNPWRVIIRLIFVPFLQAASYCWMSPHFQLLTGSQLHGLPWNKCLCSGFKLHQVGRFFIRVWPQINKVASII